MIKSIILSDKKW